MLKNNLKQLKSAIKYTFFIIVFSLGEEYIKTELQMTIKRCL